MPPKKLPVPVKFSFSQEDILRSQVREMGLPHAILIAPHFGEHTLEAIVALTKDDNHTKEQACALVHGLDAFQTCGVMLGLRREDVLEPDFGAHTTSAMHTLIDQNRAFSVLEAYAYVRGLDEFQANGVEMGLTRHQVKELHFGAHTLKALDHLCEGISIKQAYEKVQGLRAAEVDGMIEFGLKRHEVAERHFGDHTIDGIRRLHEEKGVPIEEAYKKLCGLIPAQVEMVLQGTSREGVLRQSQVRVGDFMVPAPGNRVNHSGEVKCVIL